MHLSIAPIPQQKKQRMRPPCRSVRPSLHLLVGPLHGPVRLKNDRKNLAITVYEHVPGFVSTPREASLKHRLEKPEARQGVHVDMVDLAADVQLGD